MIVAVVGLTAYLSSSSNSHQPLMSYRPSVTTSTIPLAPKALAEHLQASIAPAGIFAFFDPADSCGSYA